MTRTSISYRLRLKTKCSTDCSCKIFNVPAIIGNIVIHFSFVHIYTAIYFICNTQ